MLQLGSGAAAASTMLRCSAPFFFWAAPFAGAKFAFYPLIPGLQLLRSARFRMEGWMRPSHQSQHSRQRPAPSAQRRPWRCARRAGPLRDAGASTFVICVCLWPGPFSKRNRLTGHQCDKLRPSLAATSKRRQWKPRGRPGSAWSMERPARDGTSDTSSCQAPGRAGVKGGGQLARRPTSIGLPCSRGRRPTTGDATGPIYRRSISKLQAGGSTRTRGRWAVVCLLVQDSWQVQGVLYKLMLGGKGEGSRRCTIKDRDGWCCSGVSFRARWEPDFLTARAKCHRQGRLRHRNFPSLETRS